MIHAIVQNIGLHIMRLGLLIARFGIFLINDRIFEKQVRNAVLEGLGEKRGNQPLG